ncbi:Transcriptional elongation regulator MINIYO [Nymphaea thermarum]|nr:Transcriptional elongation regulator MINIYO [Nymphaea thermarum]
MEVDLTYARLHGEISSGFLNGGFWKYSAKPSNIIPFKDQPMDDENDEEHTIRGQTFYRWKPFHAKSEKRGGCPRWVLLSPPGLGAKPSPTPRGTRMPASVHAIADPPETKSKQLFREGKP